MKFSQFIEIPPVGDVQGLFTAATGRPLDIGVTWTTWRPLDPDHLLEFQAYIRPCHRRIFTETLDDIQSPCAFLRQLLKPHGFNIYKHKDEFCVGSLKGPTHVSKKAGTTLVMT
jgi:hypothetical protein